MNLYIDIKKINKEVNGLEIKQKLQNNSIFYKKKKNHNISNILYSIDSREGGIIVYECGEKRVLKIIECNKICNRFYSSPLNVKKYEINWWIKNNIDIYIKLKYLEFPNLPKIYEVYYLHQTNISICIVQQYCGKTNLNQYLNKRTISIEKIKEILVQVISTVFFLDSYNLYHNDINLGNVIVQENIKTKRKYSIFYKNKTYVFSGCIESNVYLIDYTMSTFKNSRNQFKLLSDDCVENKYTIDIITLVVHILCHPNIPEDVNKQLQKILENNVYQINPNKSTPIYIKNRDLEKLLDFIFR